MNFREELMERIRTLLLLLVVPHKSVTFADGRTGRVEEGTHGVFKLTPNTGYMSALRGDENNKRKGEHIIYGPVEKLPVENHIPIPSAFLSFDGGVNDLDLDTFISHIVEILSIRIEIVLNDKIGVADASGPNNIRPITLQAGDFMGDISKLITKQDLQSAVNRLPDVSVRDAVISEWEFDDRYRGGHEEILRITFQIEVTNPRET